MNRQLQTYGTQQILASDPVTLVALLYGKAVMSLKSAIEAIGQNDVEGRWQANNKAVEIVKHLLMTLDMEKGGEVAANLEALYGYMLRRLLDVDIRNDARAAEEVINLLEPLCSSWSELARATRDMSPDDPAMQNLVEAASDGGMLAPRETKRPSTDEAPPVTGGVSLSA